MKSKLGRLILAVPLLLLVLPRLDADQRTESGAAGPAGMGQPSPASKITSVPVGTLLGAEVRSEADARLGKLEDLLIDLDNGRIVFAVLSGDKDVLADGRVAVPTRTLRYTAAGRPLLWRGDPEQLRIASPFRPSDIARKPQAEHLAEVYRHYGEDPYFATPQAGAARPAKTGGVHAHGKPESSRPTLGHLILASRLLDLSVRDAMDETVGEIDDLIIDAENGRLVVLVIASGGFLGLGDTQSTVPPAAVRFSGESDNRLLLTASKEALKKAPSYNANDVDRFNDPDFTDRIYDSFDAGSYSGTTAADNTRLTKRDRDPASLTPLDQSNASEDIGITTRIRRGIRARDGLSINAKNVKIITRDGHVTLRGAVRTAEEKDLIETIAAREAGESGRVTSQLEVVRKSSP